MSGRLHMLLMAIREGMASEEAVVEARTLLLGDARVPPELREEALTEPVEREADAAALLSLLGLDDELSDMLRGAVSGEAGEMGAVNTKSPWNESASPVAEALVSASGGVDVAESVLGRVDRDGSDWVYGPALASAVALEAGDSPVSVVEVLSRCELPQGAAVSEAVLAAAGRADVVAGVSSALSFEDSCPVAEAVRFECGFVDIADVVMDRLEQGSSAVSDLATVPAPANRSWGAWATAAIAAAVLLVVGPSAFESDSGAASGLGEPIRFAMAAEVIVEDLSYSDTVQVMQTEGDEGALIIWLDEEAVL